MIIFCRIYYALVPYAGSKNLLIRDKFRVGRYHVKCSNFCKFSDGSGFEHIIFSFWLSDCDENS